MRKWFILFVFLLSLLPAWNLLLPVLFASSTYNDIESLPASEVAIVPGASVISNEKPSAILLERLETSINLYRKNKVRFLLLSGDGSSQYYNEVNVMMRYAIRHNVPRENLLLDTNGLRTLDTMTRAKDIYRIENAVIITQKLYLPRALLLAKSAGLKAVGFPADMGRAHRSHESNLREHFARYLALWDIITRK